MMELEEAVERILQAVPAAGGERVSLDAAHGRYLIEEVRSGIDLPAFTNSSMDGYAVRAADTVGASMHSPRTLKLVGRAEAGFVFQGRVDEGQCVRVFTGSALPEGADAVVMQEDTRTAAGDCLEIVGGVLAGENVRYRGEDVKRGSLVAKPGDRLQAGKLALLGAVGVGNVLAGRRPQVGILATGSELREPGQALGPGQIYESNRSALAALLRGAGAEVQIYPLVRDDLQHTCQALSTALEGSDMLVTSGGVSVGEMDFLKEALERSGGELSFWKVALKPGRPFVFGRCKGKLVFGVPGNPVSAIVTALLLVRPAVLKWQGAAEVGLGVRWGMAAEDLVNEGNRRHFMRIRLDRDGQLHSAGLQGSHVLSSLAAADGLVDLAPGTTLRRGHPARVLTWD